MASSPVSQNPRAPHLSETELRQALDELAAKIQTLRNRAHATAAGSPNTYLAHADALELKRARLAQQLGESPTPAEGQDEPGVWEQIRRGIATLRDDLSHIL